MSQAGPSRAEPGRAEPGRAEPSQLLGSTLSPRAAGSLLGTAGCTAWRTGSASPVYCAHGTFGRAAKQNSTFTNLALSLNLGLIVYPKGKLRIVIVTPSKLMRARKERWEPQIRKVFLLLVRLLRLGLLLPLLVLLVGGALIDMCIGTHNKTEAQWPARYSASIAQPTKKSLSTHTRVSQYNPGVY